MNRILSALAFALVMALLTTLPATTPTPAAATDTELAQSQDLMQCMERCIREEGKTEKATCKSKCANIPSAFGQQQQRRDCMAVFKSCKRNCPKADKNCHRACKDALMQCN